MIYNVANSKTLSICTLVTYTLMSILDYTVEVFNDNKYSIGDICRMIHYFHHLHTIDVDFVHIAELHDCRPIFQLPTMRKFRCTAVGYAFDVPNIQSNHLEILDITASHNHYDHAIFVAWCDHVRQSPSMRVWAWPSFPQHLSWQQKQSLRASLRFLLLGTGVDRLQTLLNVQPNSEVHLVASNTMTAIHAWRKLAYCVAWKRANRHHSFYHSGLAPIITIELFGMMGGVTALIDTNGYTMPIKMLSLDRLWDSALLDTNDLLLDTNYPLIVYGKN